MQVCWLEEGRYKLEPPAFARWSEALGSPFGPFARDATRHYEPALYDLLWGANALFTNLPF